MSATDWTKLFDMYKGKWVALKNDETTVVASGKNAQDVLNDAIEQGVIKPVMLKVPTSLQSYIGKYEFKDF